MTCKEKLGLFPLLYNLPFQIMKKYIFILAATTSLIVACKSKVDTATTTAIHIVGLASPIQLKYDTTVVYITDYFADVKGLDSVVIEKHAYQADTSGKILITHEIAAPVGNMEVYYHHVRHDIPVFKSEKVKHHFTYQTNNKAVQQVEMSGSMNGWNRKATPLTKEGDTWTADLILTKGLYQYRIWEDGKEMMDANNPNKISNGMGAFNNTFQVGTEADKKPQLITQEATDKSIKLLALAPVTHAYAYFENALIPCVVQGDVITIEIPNAAKALDKSHIRVYGHDGQSRANDILIPLKNGEVITKANALDRKDMHASVMYFVMVDRFVDGDKTNDRPTPNDSILPKANNMGGDLAGITQKIKDGYFSKIGINTIWISPISTNAEGSWGLWNKGTTSTFSAYHGYWPTALRSIDNRFGNDAQLRELISVAHENKMNVVLDYVAHHVHKDHPLYKQKPDWTTPLYLPDGRMNTELWDEQRLTTWFDTFLPTWNFENPQVVHALTDTAMYWVENYDLDGFRHDATKHIREEFWRELTSKVKQYKRAHPERNIYQVGETYGNPELISSYIGSGMLDAQFDFNLYDAAVDAFAKNETNFENLQRVMNESMKYYGSHHLMGNITGNQDRARFTSYADGSVQFNEDAKLAGWTRDIENKDSTGFQKMKMLSAFLMTTPGIPCIYYGDEIGMPGGNDPDNRRMMHFDDWNAWQQKLFDAESTLVKLRRENMALIYGDLITLYSDDTSWVYARTYFGQTVIVALNKSNETKTISFDVPNALKPQKLTSMYGKKLIDVTTKVTLEMKPWDFEILK